MPHRLTIVSFLSLGALTALLAVGPGGCDCTGGISVRLVAEMQIDPDQLPADGRPGAEISLRIFTDTAERRPMQGVMVEFSSSRNQHGQSADEIEQPSLATDADGRAVGFIGSLEVGEAVILAHGDGRPLCADYDGDECVPVRATVTFSTVCDPGLRDCDGVCVDLFADAANCGSCENACAFDHSEALCLQGQCALGACEPDWRDCNLFDPDGCESHLSDDPLHCGSCENACADWEICRDGACARPCRDMDADSYEDALCGGVDCDDEDPDVHPGAAEVCNGIDDDCDGLPDQGLDDSACEDQNECTQDVCEAGVGCQNVSLDGNPCDDGDVCTTVDTCANSGCFGQLLDEDGDGYGPLSCGGADCDDLVAGVNPGISELGGLCGDGLDNDCDGDVDGDDGQCQACGLDVDCDDGNPCNGTETCQAQVCQAGLPPDCDDGNPCTADSCDPAAPGGCVYADAVAACDDDLFCTVNDTCAGGTCQGQAMNCAAVADDCNAGVCDEGLDTCVPDPLPDASACDDGLFCTDGDACVAGVCLGGPNDCSGVADQCNTGRCDEGLGACVAEPVVDGTWCSDGLYCSNADACTAGLCSGTPVDCSGWGDACKLGECDDVLNSCVATPVVDGTACDDGTWCSETDVCTSGACVGVARDCSGVSDSCNAGACDEATDTCLPQALPNGTGCDDGDACSMNDACNGGLCGGLPLDADGDGSVDQACGGLDCDDGNGNVNPGVFEGPYGDALCSDGVDNDCDSNTDGSDVGCRQCSVDPDCDDGDVCNGAETCQAGVCVSGTNLDCNDGNPCTDNACDAQLGCQATNHTRACDDGVWCTLNDVCDGAGSCVGAGSPCGGVCLASCNEVQQACDPSPDGSACDDGTWCSENDSCTAGVCAGTARDCSAAGSACYAGVCDEGTDACVPQVVPDGTNCDDGLYCSVGDACTAGSCAGTPRNCAGAGDQCNAGVCDEGADACAGQARADGTICNDGLFCSVSDECTAGVCGGASRDCSAAGDSCNDGMCSEANDACLPQAKPDGTVCDDGLFCAVNDECTSGVCGGSARDCSAAGDQCNTGVCNEGSNLCEAQPLADGAGCDDGLWCFRNDSCTGGACSGQGRDCSGASNQCNTGVCNEGTDTCEPQPVIDGTVCNDGQYCTDPDACTAGTCAGAARDCSAAGDQCNNGICDEIGDACQPQAIPNGSACDDADACTMTDECTAGACAGVPLDGDGDGYADINCMGGDDCNDGDFDVNPGVFEGPGGDPMCDDSADNDCDLDIDLADNGCGECFVDGDCNNNDVCDGAETCVAGSCVPGTSLNCNDGDPCTDDSCDGLAGCQASFNVAPCDDGLWCTASDVCDGAGLCVGSGSVCLSQCLQTCNEALDQCEPSPNGTGCNDGLWCTPTDECTAGVCGGAARDCSGAGDQCKAGVCDEIGDVCTTSPLADGTLCDDGFFCTDPDTCDGAGNCTGGLGDPCINVCQTICDEGSNICTNDPDGTVCNDSDACTMNDECTAGTCDGPPTDGDGDGYVWDVCSGGDDCSDGNGAINPGATEVCDGVDNDCDGLNDWRLCANQSGACAGALETCSAGAWAACDYTQQADFEYVEQSCDSIDNNCDGCTDERCAGYSNPIVAVEVIPYSDQPGLRRLSGNGQFGPVGTLLPNKLIVQLNENCGAPPCGPRPGEMVSFVVESRNSVCYGQGGTYAPSNGLNPITILQVCNDVDTSSLVGPTQVRTDINGQASIQLRLSDTENGVSAVSATNAGQTVVFFATSSTLLSNTIVVPTENSTSLINPSLGPLVVTDRPEAQGPAQYLGNINNYTLAITGLSATTGSSGDGVPWAGLSAGGSLTISGSNFSANNNTVWIGGTQANIIAQSASSITVDIPEGTPGAAAVVVFDGSTTPFVDGVGYIQSIASVVANFWRTGPKPIFLFAATGTRNGSSALVKLVGMDVCGNPLNLTGETLNLWAEDPDGSTPADAVSVSAPNASSGLATVVHRSSARRAAVLMGTVGALSSDDLPDGNLVATTVPDLLLPGNWHADPALSNDDGINSIILRGGDESSTTDAAVLNPAIRFQSTAVNSYSIPDGSGPVYANERNLLASTMVGEGDMRNTPGSGVAAMAGTGLFVISGGASGVLGVFSARALYEINMIITIEGSMDVNGMSLSGVLRQTGAEQEIEMNSSGLMYYDADGDELRNIILRLLFQRPLP